MQGPWKSIKWRMSEYQISLNWFTLHQLATDFYTPFSECLYYCESKIANENFLLYANNIWRQIPLLNIDTVQYSYFYIFNSNHLYLKSFRPVQIVCINKLELKLCVDLAKISIYSSVWAYCRSISMQNQGKSVCFQKISICSRAVLCIRTFFKSSNVV